MNCVNYQIAIIGMIGVFLGAAVTSLGGIVKDWFQRKGEFKKDEPRRKLLRKMLEDNQFPDKWRNLSTLMHVIGADESTTKRLLLEVGARGSENGKDLWGLWKYHPFERER